MSLGNAWKYAPARQARLQADMQNPEWVRRQELYRKARGQEMKRRIAHWNIAWNQAGRPADFPDFPEWDARPRFDAIKYIDARLRSSK
jgi:hypothetical protein